MNVTFVRAMRSLLLGSVAVLIVSVFVPSIGVVRWIGLGAIFISPILGSLNRSVEFVRNRQWSMMAVLLTIWITFGVVAYLSLKKDPV
jgi:hypothetical protein